VAEISREEFDRRFRPAEYAKRKSLGLYGNTERRQTRYDPGMPAPRSGSSPIYDPNTDSSRISPEEIGYSSGELAAELEDQRTRAAADAAEQAYGNQPRYKSEENARKAANRAAKNRNYARGQQWATNFREQDTKLAQAQATEGVIEDLNRTGRDANIYATDPSAIGDAYRRSVSDLTPKQAKVKATYLGLGFSEADADRFARGDGSKSRRDMTSQERRDSLKRVTASPEFGEITPDKTLTREVRDLLKSAGVKTPEQFDYWRKNVATQKDLELLDQAKRNLLGDKMVAQDNKKLQAESGQVDPKKAKGGLNIPGKTARGGGPVEKFLIPMLMAPATEEFTDPQTGVTTKQPATYLVPKKVRDEVRMFPQFDADAVNLLFLDPTAEVSPALAEKYGLYKSIDHQEYNREYRGDTNDVRSKAFNTPRVDTANLGDSSNFNIGADTGKVRPMKVGEALSFLAYKARTDLVKLRGQAYQDPVTGRTIPPEFYEVAGGDINDPNSAPARVFQRTGQAQDVEIFDLLESRRTAGLTPAEIDAGIEVFRRGGNFMYADTGMQTIQSFLEDLTRPRPDLPGQKLLVNERMGGMDYGIKNLQAGLVSSVSPGAMRQSQGSSKYPSPVAGLMKLFHDAGRIGDDPTNPSLYPDPRTVQAVAAMPAQSENLSFLDQSMLASDAAVRKELAGMSGFVKGYTPEVSSAMKAANEFFAQGIERQLASKNPSDQLNALQAIAKFRAKRGI
tara:strand:- start:2658 stop:4865 length:2208 start_codon:yes stop_codon:yes gene_type:complete